jgi:hypothetical protein
MIASLPRREREIFEILCSAGEATAADVRRAMADAPQRPMWLQGDYFGDLFDPGGPRAPAIPARQP